MLTTKQIEFFQEHGYLILKNLIDPEIIDGWRTQIWEHFNSSLETPETWPNDYEIQDQLLAVIWTPACDARGYRAAW